MFGKFSVKSVSRLWHGWRHKVTEISLNLVDSLIVLTTAWGDLMLRWLLVVDLLDHARLLLVVQALRDGCLLIPVLDLLFHAVVEHAEAEEIDRNGNDTDDNYDDKEPCLQIVKAF